MPIKVTCSKCQGVLHAPDDAGGKRGKCPTCGTVLAIPGGSGGSMMPPESDQPLAQTPFNAAPPPRQASTVFGSPGTDDRRGSFAPGLIGPGSSVYALCEKEKISYGGVDISNDGCLTGLRWTPGAAVTLNADVIFGGK